MKKFLPGYKSLILMAGLLIFIPISWASRDSYDEDEQKRHKRSDTYNKPSKNTPSLKKDGLQSSERPEEKNIPEKSFLSQSQELSKTPPKSPPFKERITKSLSSIFKKS